MILMPLSIFFAFRKLSNFSSRENSSLAAFSPKPARGLVWAREKKDNKRKMPMNGFLMICRIVLELVMKLQNGRWFPLLFLKAFDILAVIGQDYFVVFIHKRRSKHKVRSGAVAGDREIPCNAQPQQGLDIRVMGLGLHRVPEENKHVDLPLRYPGADLLIPA